MKKSNGRWPARVEQRKEQRAANRDRAGQVSEELNVKILALQQERGEITKISLTDYVAAKISHGEFTKRMVRADALGEELKPLIEARDQVLREKNELAEKADAEMVSGLVDDINQLTKKQAGVLKELTGLLPGLHEKASELCQLQECRYQLYTMARSITRSRTNLGLARDAELEKVCGVGDSGSRELAAFLKSIIHAASNSKGGGLFGIKVPARLWTAPPAVRENKKPGKVKGTVYTVADRAAEHVRGVHPTKP